MQKGPCWPPGRSWLVPGLEGSGRAWVSLEPGGVCAAETLQHALSVGPRSSGGR